MKNNNVIMIILFCLTAYSSVLLAQNADPKEIFANSGEACSKLKSIEYSVMVTVEDGSGNSNVLAEAAIKQARIKVKNDNYLPGYFSANVKMSFGRTHGEVSYAYTGDELVVVDTENKEITYIQNPSTMKSFDLIGPVSMIGLPDYTRENPFEKMLASSDSIKMGSDVKIFDENCYSIEVYITKPNQDGTLESNCSIWYISKNDFLPRGVYNAPLIFKVRIMKTDFTVDKEAFNIPIPKGYTEKRITDSK